MLGRSAAWLIAIGNDDYFTNTLEAKLPLRVVAPAFYARISDGWNSRVSLDANRV